MTGGIRLVQMETQHDAKSMGSYRSTHSSHSSVLERAREYNRRLDEQKTRRSKSLERQSDIGDDTSATSGTPRSQSAGRISSNIQGNRPATRERAMASIQRESLGAPPNNVNRSINNAPPDNQNHAKTHRGGNPLAIEANQPTPLSRVSGESPAYTSHVSRPTPTTPRMSPEHSSYKKETQPQPERTPNGHQHNHRSRHPQQVHPDHSHDRHQAVDPNRSSIRSLTEISHHPTSRSGAPTPRETPTVKTAEANNRNHNHHKDHPPKEEFHEAVVTPELLVDALSGHEDGLLAIAEKLMEHYDSGYDVMGEAIIDAFADVQKLFQHVVEAAHMEGAAFEASRKEEEIAELRKQAAAASVMNGGHAIETSQSPAAGPTRHDEFIDQDVKDVLTEAIKQGTTYRNSNKFSECYQLYEQACQSASALLPVDSDHRGRLQLSVARAESMSHERACAILRYAMDDVLRSGLRAGNVTLPDPSQRADVVLTRPKNHPSITGATGVQSSEEALNSLVEEMREVMQAPVYNNTPLQSVAKRFLSALADVQKAQHKNEEKLEQNLARLKGDFLLARAEWEEKLNSTQETAEIYKEKYQKLKDSMIDADAMTGSTTGSSYLDHARSALASQQHRVTGTQDEDDSYNYYHVRSSTSRAGSQVSLGSGLANQARDGVRNLVGSFSCAGGNQRSGSVVAQELAEHRDAEIRDMAFRHDSGKRDRDRRRATDNRRSSGNQNLSMSYSDRSFSSEAPSNSTGGQQRRTHTPHSVASGSTRSKSSRSFREYSRSPQRVDF